MSRDVFKEISKVMEEIHYDFCGEDIEVVTAQYLPDFENATDLYIIFSRELDGSSIVYMRQYHYIESKKAFAYTTSDIYTMHEQFIYEDNAEAPTIHDLSVNLIKDYRLEGCAVKLLVCELMRVNKKEIGAFITVRITTPYNTQFVTRFYRKTPTGYKYEDSKTAAFYID